MPTGACTISRSTFPAKSAIPSARTIKGGTTFEFTRILTGELAVGWLTRKYEDPTLLKVAGLTLDGSLTWVASALTTAKLTAVTRADESRVVGVSGVFTREVALQVDHAFRRWLIATAKVLYGNDDYVGSPRDDNRYSASAAITYKLTRELWLKSEVPPRLAALVGRRRELRRGRHPAHAARAAVRGRPPGYFMICRYSASGAP